MLKVYIDECTDNIEIVSDVEKEFSKLVITGTDLDRTIIEKIENGRYNDSNSFIDRFGYKLRVEDMSTGCKAALCVVNAPDKIISTAECGINALDAIFNCCKIGNIIIKDNGYTVSQYDDTEEICVEVDGIEFESAETFNRYVQDERPFI